MTTAKLGDVAEFINGFPFKPEDWHEGGLPIVRIQNLTDPSKPINATTRRVPDRFRVTRGELLVSWSATLGVFVWNRTDEALVNQHIFRVVPTSQVDQGFLRHMLEGALVSMERHLHGATMKHVNRGEFLSTEIPLPPLDEQRRIAAILDHADALRAKRRQVIAHLDALVQSIYSDMFSGLDGESVPLAHLAQIWDCPHSTPKWTVDGEVCLRTPNLTRGGWNWDDTRYVDRAQFDSRSKGGGAQPGDIILSREGTVGIAAIVAPAMRVCMGQRLVQVRVAEKLLPEFALEFLLNALHPDRIGQVMVGSTAQHLNVSDLRALATPVPQFSLQEEFRSRAWRIGEQRSVVVRALVADDELLNSLQSRAFRGEL